MWLNQNDACGATGKTTVGFSKLKPTLRQRKKKKRTEFFIPDTLMTKKMRKAYADVLVEFDDQAEQVEDVLGDVSDTPELLGTNAELAEAKLLNIRARTSFINERLEAHKQELWTEWNAAVFDEFASSFARLKNALISLKLNEKQIETLNNEIDHAVTNLSNRLDAMWNDFNKEDNEEEET